ncbi:TM183 protein, partial [Turnix velox]|nr:TM183 protein [Turnix velox]
MEKLHCLRACVIRSLYHMYEPFASRVSRNPAIPDSTPSTLKNSRPSLCGTLEPLWCQQECLPFKDHPPNFWWSSRTADPWTTSSAP